MSDEPRLRGKSGSSSGPWQIGQIPERVIYAIGRQLVHRLAYGRMDISGDDFGDIFAAAIDGAHHSSPLGMVDVLFGGVGWSVKTVKSAKPQTQRQVRLISGRNSPDFSSGIKNPHADLQATGQAVLAVWNSRLNAARKEQNDVCVAVLIRNMQTQCFTLFEEEITRYVAADYEWRKNERGNLQGHRKTDGKHCFTWQFHGSQFTIFRAVPGSATHFKINCIVPRIEPSHIESLIRYNDGWIEIG